MNVAGDGDPGDSNTPMRGRKVSSIQTRKNVNSYVIIERRTNQDASIIILSTHKQLCPSYINASETHLTGIVQRKLAD